MRKNMAEIITENRTGQRTGICIIIGAGELTVDAIPVRPEDFVIAADGGYAHCRQLGVEPDLILGDFDSLDEENRRHVEALRREQPDRVRVFRS